MGEPLSSNLMKTLTHHRRMECQKHEFELKIIESDLKKAKSHMNLIKASFIRNRAFRHNEWWSKDRHYREGLRNAFNNRKKANDFLRQSGALRRSKSNLEETTKRSRSSEAAIKDSEK
jgi:hypothetical protein